MPGPSLLIPCRCCSFLLELLDIQRYLDGCNARSSQDGINLLQTQFNGRWKEEIGQDQLNGVVCNVHHPDLIPDLADPDSNSIGRHSASTTLIETVQAYSFCPKKERKGSHRVQVVHGCNEHCREGLVEEGPEKCEGCGWMGDVETVLQGSNRRSCLISFGSDSPSAMWVMQWLVLSKKTALMSGLTLRGRSPTIGASARPASTRLGAVAHWCIEWAAGYSDGLGCTSIDIGVEEKTR